MGIPTIIKCPECKWMRLEDYDGLRSKKAAFAWADKLHQKERPACGYKFRKYELKPIPKGQEPYTYIRRRVKEIANEGR